MLHSKSNQHATPFSQQKVYLTAISCNKITQSIEYVLCGLLFRLFFLSLLASD